jgi:2-polyprenyl-3-methyl-5-hydroxy-6-metoxy-1,4-benzoquinol methylase
VNDKKIEKNRFNIEANKALEDNNLFSANKLTLPLKTPYAFYQKLIFNYVHNDSFVLEIGAGMGENTEFLLATGAKVYATDISESYQTFVHTYPIILNQVPSLSRLNYAHPLNNEYND